jgi:Ca-activated chloride channel family protein
VALVLALMRPQWGVEFVTSPQVGAEIMIALDVSKSMLAEDVAPNRLERAKAEIRDLLPYLEGDQVGLIAFAGRASVLCPLTPDFGFLRLVLDNVDVGTVRRGGTRLEEPIRKATKGFGGSGDLSRVILLITDGEDHDSFPVDAAEEAAEQGIRIISIGFGDEDGSQITVTDPDTGARTVLRDDGGSPVISRLDGDLLRELAMVTQGAYVPAGTGVLDLESIFDAHIRPLMRGTGEERGKTIRKDGFQWPILVALLALLGSVATHATRASFFSAFLILVQLQLADISIAQPTLTPSAIDEEAAALFDEPPPGEVETGDEGSEGRARLELPEDAREAFNQGLDELESGALDDAERLFEAARRQSGADAEVRFRATYNQGWIDVERAESDMESDPQSALTSLRRSADWFREAIALRPNNDDARRNLEIVLARSLVLADALAEHEPRDIDARLDELIDLQRAAAAGVREIVELIGQIDDPEAADSMRPQFKRMAVEERKILSLASALSDLAGEELDSLENIAEEELTPEDNMRRAQLGGLLHYLHRARERIGQSRSQLRQRQAERAYRRAAAGLSNLKRARDQLLDPVQVLDGVIRDAVQLAGETRGLVSADLGLALGAGSDPAAQPPPEAPAWLNSPYLAEMQDEIRERTDELNARFSAGLAQAEGVDDPQQLALLEQVGEAQPHVEAASLQLSNALEALEADRPMDAQAPQSAALAELIQARERFLDLKRLIEIAYEDEKRITGFLSPQAEIGEEQLAEYGPALMQVQEQNLERLVRMTPMIEGERAKLQAELAGQEESGGEGGAGQQALERLDLADGILALTESAMKGATESLGMLGESEEALEQSRSSVETAMKGLETLRRLFFSIVEHIRDTAERQVELGDDTEEASSSEPDRLLERVGPIAAHQDELAKHTDSLAEALHQQSFADPAELLGPDAAADEAAAAEAVEKLTQASELVLAAGAEMARAAEGLGAEEKEFESIRSQQTTAVEKLAEALALLQPPQEQQEPQEQQQDEQQQQEQQQGQQEEQPPEEQESSDPTQLLQSVRDREAERHRNQSERNQRGYEPVEKDW